MEVGIIGAGPAGIAAANELAEEGYKPVVIDKKSKIGGAGLVSDGKLNVSYYKIPFVAGSLDRFINKEKANRLLEKVDSLFLRNGVPDEAYGTNDKIKELEREATQAGMNFKRIKQRHIGSDELPKVMSNIRESLENKGVKFILGTEIKDVKKKNGIFCCESKNQTYKFKKLMIAPGRQGATWLIRIANKFGIETIHQPVDVGVRVEVPSSIMEPVTDIAWDPKYLIRTPTFDDQVRTFCTCPYGYVVKEVYENYICINGHSLSNRRSENTNFALLSTVRLTEPIEDTKAYGEMIAKLANTLGGQKPIIQRVSDLRRGRRSTERRIKMSPIKPTLEDCTPGDISMALPERIITNLLETLEKLDQVIPGVANGSNLLYAPELKLYARRIKTDKNLETKIDGLFVAGDGAGVSRSITTAAVTGILAARGLMKN